MKKVFLVKLTPCETGYFVTIPDLDINTEGKDLANAIEMARDAIGLWGITEEDAGRSIPNPKLLNIDHESDEIIALVDIDFIAYRKANDTRTIRKNCTIPSWLNVEAEAAKINFSKVLTEALEIKLGK